MAQIYIDVSKHWANGKIDFRYEDSPVPKDIIRWCRKWKSYVKALQSANTEHDWPSAIDKVLEEIAVVEVYGFAADHL